MNLPHQPRANPDDAHRRDVSRLTRTAVVLGLAALAIASAALMGCDELGESARLMPGVGESVAATSPAAVAPELTVTPRAVEPPSAEDLTLLAYAPHGG